MAPQYGFLEGKRAPRAQKGRKWPILAILADLASRQGGGRSGRKWPFLALFGGPEGGPRGVRFGPDLGPPDGGSRGGRGGPGGPRGGPPAPPDFPAPRARAPGPGAPPGGPSPEVGSGGDSAQLPRGTSRWMTHGPSATEVLTVTERGPSAMEVLAVTARDLCRVPSGDRQAVGDSDVVVAARWMVGLTRR